MTPESIDDVVAAFVERTRWRDMTDAPRDGTRIEMRFRDGRPLGARYSPPGTAPHVWRFDNKSALRASDEAGWQWRYPA